MLYYAFEFPGTGLTPYVIMCNHIKHQDQISHIQPDSISRCATYEPSSTISAVNVHLLEWSTYCSDILERNIYIELKHSLVISPLGRRKQKKRETNNYGNTIACAEAADV